MIEPKQKERMNISEAGKILYQAYVTKLPMRIQTNVLRNGNWHPDLERKITGYVEHNLYFLLKDRRRSVC